MILQELAEDSCRRGRPPAGRATAAGGSSSGCSVVSSSDRPAAAAVFFDASARGRCCCTSSRVTVAHPAHGLDHVDRHADRAALVGDGPGDGLANPPGGIGRELVAAGVLELVDRPHQARVALPGSGPGSSGRGCGSAWRWRRPAAGCRPTARAWPRRIAAGSAWCGRRGGGAWRGFPA